MVNLPLITAPFVADHTPPLGRQHRVRLSQPRASEPVADELDLNEPRHRPADRDTPLPPPRRSRSAGQQLDGPIQPNRVLVRISATECHQSVEYYASRPVPSPRTADPSDQTLELEVRDCIQSAKALRRAIKDVFGKHALVHRCHRHKERNATELHPKRERPAVLLKIRGTWALTDPGLAQERLERLASELERTWLDAAASLREGMSETLTLMRLGIGGQLAKSLCSTNPCESMIEIVRHTQRNVKRWQDGDMRKRWTAAGMLVAEQQFRRIIGYRHLAQLVIAIERRTAPLARATDTAVTHTQMPEAVTV